MHGLMCFTATQIAPFVRLIVNVQCTWKVCPCVTITSNHFLWISYAFIGQISSLKIQCICIIELYNRSSFFRQNLI